MGYFSNGSEGMDYEARYCSKCVHQPDCIIWDLHMLHNYEECNKKDSFLHSLIPMSEDGLSNDQCTMFLPAEKALAINLEKQVDRIQQAWQDRPTLIMYTTFERKMDDAVYGRK